MNENEISKTWRQVDIDNPPAINVLSDDEFRDRAKFVFSIIDDILSRSFGPYGAPTLIADYPYVHATKDGYTIARNIAFDPEAGSPVDRVIFKQAMDICGRVNYSVGDGTTTAIIATNRMFYAVSQILDKLYMPSAVFMKTLNGVKDQIVTEFEKEITTIHSDDSNLKDVIKKIAMVSSNGDEVISDMIAEAYDTYRYPVLRCDEADGPDTFLDETEGYKSKVRLGDRIYINSDLGVAEYRDLDVIIFDHQVKERTYSYIISRLHQYARNAGRKLVCIAPSYDDTTLNVQIRRDVMTEYKTTKSSTLIIMAYPNNNDRDRESIHDLAMLLNTTVIDRAMETDLIGEEPALMHIGVEPLLQKVNILDRGIKIADAKYSTIYTALNHAADPTKLEKDYKVTLGHADGMIADMKETTFEVSDYDKTLYEKVLSDAKRVLDEVTSKYEILGTYTTDVYDAQTRYTSLLMKTAVIYVGGDSKLSRDLRVDSVEDAVRAAESAFKYGYVKGGNISLIRAIRRVKEALTEDAKTDNSSKVKVSIAQAFENAFFAVYGQVLMNDPQWTADGGFDVIINNCIESNKVYDIVKNEYSDDIINSAHTDVEVITATVDLLGILLTGNQVIISRYQHKEIPEDIAVAPSTTQATT